MPVASLSYSAIIEGCAPQELPYLLEEIVNKLRYNIRTEGEEEKTNALSYEVSQLKADLSSCRADKEEYRQDVLRLRRENNTLTERVNELLKAGAPTPILCENEKQLIRDSHNIAAIKALRERVLEEHKYSLGLKEAKDLCDAYKAEWIASFGTEEKQTAA